MLSWRSKQARVNAQIRDMCAILSGLVVASDYKLGQQLVTDRNFADNAEFFRDCFEVGRRHKVSLIFFLPRFFFLFCFISL